MNWFGRKFRNAPNDQLSESGGEEGELGVHIGDWVELGTEPHSEITLVTSLMDRPHDDASIGPVHAPVLDLDLEHIYYLSTTPGHAALLLNVALTWEDYLRLIDLLEELSIIEFGFAEATRQRGYSACRTPWTKKPAKSD